MEYLAKLFGSPARVKLLRLFLFNPEHVYDRDAAVHAARIAPAMAAKELTALGRTGLVKRKLFTKNVLRPGTKTPKKRRTIGWTLDPKHPHIPELTRFLRDTISVSDTDIKSRLRGVGAVQLLVIAGFLIDERDNSTVELLIVGNKLDEEAIQAAVRVFEAECGRDIRYAVLPVGEYLFRKRVRDKLIRDLFDYPHRVLVDRLAEQ